MESEYKAQPPSQKSFICPMHIFLNKKKLCFVMKYVDLFKQTHGWLEKKIEIAA